MQSISQLYKPSLNALLYRVTELSDETNRQLFIIIQECVCLTADARGREFDPGPVPYFRGD